MEEQQRPDLLKEILSADLGPYAVVLTDKAGNLKYAPDSWPPGNRGAALLKGKKYYYLFKDPATQPCLRGPDTGAQASQVSGVESAALGRLYLVEKEPQGLGRLLPTYDTVSTFSLLSYFMVLVGFAAICAITARYQRQSQELREDWYASELEARELRIQNLETNIGAADLRLELLDRSQEEAQEKRPRPVFYFWPIYFCQNNGIGTDNPEKFRASIAVFCRHPLAPTRFHHRALAVFHLD